ncbi:hypothetical protein [Ephemeroptericola cinctiostellae]|nr:hypothetical protein [Ephemeroptericola cinctiostellae]
MNSHLLKWLMFAVIVSLMATVHAQAHVEYPEVSPAVGSNSHALMMKPEDFPKTQTTAPEKVQKQTHIRSQIHRTQAPRQTKRRTHLSSHERMHRKGHAVSTMAMPCAPVKPVQTDVCSMPK